MDRRPVIISVLAAAAGAVIAAHASVFYREGFEHRSVGDVWIGRQGNPQTAYMRDRVTLPATDLSRAICCDVLIHL